MKSYKCDRCDKRFDGVYRAYGLESQYFGMIEVYSYSDMPRTETLDLCQECQIELDKFVRKFIHTKGATNDDRRD
jgi:hypothetical protein